jgi:hypothetical protein
MKTIPTDTDIRAYAPTVPIPIAAAYLGMSAQSVREGIKDGSLNIGCKAGHKYYVYPSKLIAFKTGTPDDLSVEMKTVEALMKHGLICFDDILKLAGEGMK